MSENNVSNTASAEFANIRPLYESRYGNSRIFTATYGGRKVIIKALKERYADDPKCRAALHEEYDITSLLDHRLIRKAIDYVNIEGLGDCIVFEYVEGKSLAEHVRVGTLSEKQVKSVLVDICDALSYMHRNQMVHCNLKPENIIVTNDYHAKLIDLGAPKTEQDADRELLIKEMAFVAPEIIKGEDYDSRADVFSLGKIMEFMGERNISKQFNAVATHCTQFSKEQRYDSISEVRAAITKGHPVVKIVVAAAAVALIAILAIIYIPRIKVNVGKERSERMAKDFNREITNMQNELPALYEKYQLKSLDEPIAFEWSEDSLRYVKNLLPYFGSEDLKSQALKALGDQRKSIEESRRSDFDRILVQDFKQATDSVALQLKTVLRDPTDDQLLIIAGKWYNQVK